MNKYMISYDLDKPGQNYSRVIERMRQHGAFRLQMSLWIVKTSWTAPQLRDDLMKYMDSNDRLIVAGLDGEAAWHNLLISNEKYKEVAA